MTTRDCPSTAWRVCNHILTTSSAVADVAVLIQSWILGEQELMWLVELLQSVCQISQFGFLQGRLGMKHHRVLNHCELKKKILRNNRKLHPPSVDVSVEMMPESLHEGERQKWKTRETIQTVIIFTSDKPKAPATTVRKKMTFLQMIVQLWNVFSFN